LEIQYQKDLKKEETDLLTTQFQVYKKKQEDKQMEFEDLMSKIYKL
jgi:chaperonin cofactor prefoldin